DDLGIRSLLCVPLWAHRRALGALTITSERPSVRYQELDLALAEDLGHRVAVAVDNAQLYEEAQRAVRVRDDVLDVVSHDLRTPLTCIVAAAALLLRSPAITEAGEREVKSARMIQRSAARMNVLLDDLRDVASINAGRLQLKRPVRWAVADLMSETR